MNYKDRYSRRCFLRTSALAGVALSMGAAESRRAPRILLRGSWQSVNIGDIGHTPGALSLLQKYLPEAEVTLWAGEIGHGARELLLKNFPRLQIVQGSLKDGQPGAPNLAAAWEWADLLLHGSGSGFPASHDVEAFLRATGKPAGVFGVSTDPISGITTAPEGNTLARIRTQAAALPPTHLSAHYRYVLDHVAFMFTRDTISRDYLQTQGVKTPILEFGPDTQLAMAARDDAKGLAYLQANGLEKGKFICTIPRLRYTPYHKDPARKRKDTPEAIAKKDEINARTVETDHAVLRELITRYVRETKNKVLACPEMTYQIALAKEQLVDPLPADVKRNVVWRDTYWLPDEAASIYAQALAVISLECHSPLIALQAGTPTIHIRQPTDTCKGQMYPDLGLEHWFFEVEQTEGGQLWSRIEAIHRGPAQARDKVKAVMLEVEKRQQRMAESLRAALPRA
jgi:polysaccharide pyruvyl transferase WcaK-like protein